VPETVQSAPSSPCSPILAQPEANRRMLLLTELRAALTDLGLACVLARKHRLVLRYNHSPIGASGLTDPQLHVFSPDGTIIATTDGTAYLLDSGSRYPASDPAAAALAIQHGRLAG
jgi:hypothetical protein